ncbi:MAG TPA: hypothetical protein VK674_02650 [Candidatus Limnocylindria bacterium]|nr:hypothetical protein [Candidatus Limnocylindria bacterium]
MNPRQNTRANNNGQGAEPQEPQVIGPQQSPPPSLASGPFVSPSGDVSLPTTPTTPGTPVQYPSPAPPVTGRKKRPGKKVLALVAALLVVGLGGGVFAYVTIMNNSPEKILADALTHTMTDLLDRKPSRLAGKLTFTSKEADAGYSVVVDFDSKQVGGNGQFGATVQVKVGQVLDVSVTGKAISQGSEAAYIKLDNVQKTLDQVVAGNPQAAASATMVKPLIQKIDGQWIKIEEKDLAEYGLGESKETVDACGGALEKLRISETDQKQVKEIFLANQFAIAKEELPGEAVDGDKSYHYKLDLNEEAGLHFAKDFMELESFSAVKEACKLKQEDIDQSLEDLKKQKDEEVEAEPVFELWVSQKSRRPTKLKVTLDDKEFSMENVATIKLDAPDLTIEIPGKFTTLQELTTEIEKLPKSGQALGWSAWR